MFITQREKKNMHREKKNIHKILIFLGICLLIGVIIFVTFTPQKRAFIFGGSATVDLPKGEKLVNITWKDSSLWYLTRPMKPTDTVENYSFQESSSLGVMQGKVTIRESR